MKKMNLSNNIVVLIAGGLLSLHCFFSLGNPTAFGQTVGTNECSVKSENKRVVLSITAESLILRKDEPFWVTIKIENNSDKPFDLESFPGIGLVKKGVTGLDRNKIGNSYQSIVYLDSESEFVKKKVLQKGEKIVLRVNMTDLDWGDAVLSYYPIENLFNIAPSGEYELYSEIFSMEKDTKIDRRILSNTLEVSVK